MSKRQVNFIVENIYCHQRLDLYLAAKIEPSLSRTQVKSLIKRNKVMVNGTVENKPAFKIKTGDILSITIPAKGEEELQAEDIPLDILYEDSRVIIVNKPQGMVVHPGAGHTSGTLANALLHHYPQIAKVGDKNRPGIVHRLDKDTTGLLVAAKNATALKQLQHQIKTRTAKREYLALCKGPFGKECGSIDAPLGRHPVDRKRMAVIKRQVEPEGKVKTREALTHWRVVQTFGSDYTLVLLRLHTGRTHQIRVHLSYIGHPVIGDEVYSRAKTNLKLPGLALHAFKLGLYLGEAYDEYQEFTAPLPAGLSRVLISLKNKHREELPLWLIKHMKDL